MITDRLSPLLVAGLTGILAFVPASPKLEAADRSARPNVLFLFSDDQRFDAWGGAGTEEIRTPALDRLAESGMIFTQAHIMGSMRPAVCMPSRAMLMTGRTLFHLSGDGGRIPPEHPTLPETLRRAGYATFATGKWHNDRESFARGFTHGGKVFIGGMSEHEAVPVHDFDPEGKYPNARRYKGEKHSSELFTDAAIAFLESHEAKAPFFMYVSYTAPHDPRSCPPPYNTMYDPARLKLPPNFMPEHPFDNGELRIRDEMLAPFPRTPEVVRQHIADYFAMITHLDAQIGRLLHVLRAGPHGRNTLIIFAGDNGLAVGQHGLMGKQSLYEHSIRVPLILSGPGIPEDTRTDALCYLNDLYPTICEMLGVAIPESVEGRSLRPVIRDPGAEVRDTVFYAYKNQQRGIRAGRYKLLAYLVEGQRTTQLFDLEDDPWEMRNLADSPDHQSVRRKLETMLAGRMKELDDPCDLTRPDWGCQAETTEDSDK